MPFLGLIDSGANDCCFPGSIARDLGHDLEKGKERIFEGVGGEVKTYLHQNYIQIQDVRIRGDLYFSDEWNDWGFGLLGRHGFFTHFKVIFDYRRKIFTIEH
ncbi:retropepsin-like domain-containing protein [bacterium]|nr:retropepsin-like domain-containing protein [bacterium]